MEFVNLGQTGLKVSRVCLGCMTYGVPDRGAHPWTLDEEKSRPFIKRALELGINFFDTANTYSDGTSEEIVGRALRDFARREEIVIATKVFYPMREGPNARGLSRKSIMTEIDASLRRLGTDYVDLYQIHRWDKHTPIEETLEALHDVIKAGKARYIGASSMYAWQFSKAQYVARQNGWTPFASMQNHYNLLYREEEREMMPLCAAEGVGVVPWSPLARGRLTRDWDETTNRMETDEFGKTALHGHREDADRKIVERVGGACGEAWRAARAGGVGVDGRKSLSLPRRSSAPRSRIILTMRLLRSRSISRLKKSLRWRNLMYPIRSLDSNQLDEVLRRGARALEFQAAGSESHVAGSRQRRSAAGLDIYSIEDVTIEPQQRALARPVWRLQFLKVTTDASRRARGSQQKRDWIYSPA